VTTSKIYNLEKSIWTEKDFNSMGWHDSRIHGFAITTDDENFQSELLLDIDYIFQWINPVPPDVYFTFFVAPCTLVFHNISDLTVDIETGRIVGVELEIADLHLVEKREQTDIIYWNIETQQDDIKFEASGYTQYVRQNPKLVRGQKLSLDERNGIRFDKKEIKI
jgi:hypothetical protein